MMVKDIFKSPDKWCQGTGARNAFGEPVEWRSRNARSWCLLSAVFLAYPFHQRVAVMTRIGKYLRVEREENEEIEKWNDSPSTTFLDVLKLVETLEI